MTATRALSRRRAMAILILGSMLAFAPSGASAAPKPKPPPTTIAGDKSTPTTPTDLRVTGVTRTSVSLAWNPSTDNSGTFSYVVRQDNLS